MNMRIYCLECRIKTDSNNITMKKTKNNRNLIKGTCSICGNNISVLVSAQNCGVSVKQAAVQGRGFSLNNFINNLPVELHQFAEKEENVPGGSFND